jgi:hypothetical protein
MGRRDYCPAGRVAYDATHQERLSIIGKPIMKLKLVLAISAFTAIPAVAQAKQGETPPTAPKPTLAQVQKVIQIIRGNKTKFSNIAI